MGSLAKGLNMRLSESAKNSEDDEKKESRGSTGLFGGSLLKKTEVSVETLEKQEKAL